MTTPTQAEKAENFRKLHHHEKLLILPNIWDRFSARLVAQAGYPALATASAAVALVEGYPDGEYLPFPRLLDVTRTISNTSNLPLTVDMERGFASNVLELMDNIKLLLEAGAVGINIEDSDGEKMMPTVDQCRRIEAVREVGIKEGIPLVINARTDTFMRMRDEEKLKEAISRGKAYQSAGADCLYPITVSSYQEIREINAQVDLPINVYLLQVIGNLTELEAIGVARVSVGPAFLKMVIARMKLAAENLINYETQDFFDFQMPDRDYLNKLID